MPSPEPAPLSFAIDGASSPRRCDPSPRLLRFDRFDSREVLHLARRVYVAFLADTAATKEPLGVVIELARQAGRIVFDPPLLLPGEQFIPLHWICSQARSQPTRRPSARTSPAGSSTDRSGLSPLRFTPR